MEARALISETKKHTEEAKELKELKSTAKRRTRMRAHDLQTGKVTATTKESTLSFDGVEKSIFTARDLFVLYKDGFKKAYGIDPVPWRGKEYSLAKRLIDDLGAEQSKDCLNFVFSRKDEFESQGAGILTIAFLWAIRQTLVLSVKQNRVLYNTRKEEADRNSRNKKHFGEFGAKKKDGLPEVGWGDFWK